MADQSPELLRETPTNVVTSEAPRGYLSSGQIEAPFRDASALLDKMGQTADAFEVPAAERQAASDLANQKVVRSPDGSVNVLNPASAMLFGDAGRAYSKAIQSGTADQIMAQVRPDLAAIHAQSPLDSAQVAKNNDAYFTKLATSTSGMGVIGEEVMKQARDIGSQHQGMAVTAGANNEIENTKKSILATLEDSKNTLSGMAAVPGKPNTPEYQAAVKNYNDSLDKLGTNDLFKMPAAYLATQRKEFMGELQATQAGAQIDSIYDKRGKAAAQQEALKIIQNPDIPPEKANLLYRQTMSRLEYRSNDQTAAQKAASQSVGIIQTGLANNKLDPTSSDIAAMREQARVSNNADAVNQIDALVMAARAHRAVMGLPPSQQVAALGGPTAATDVAGPRGRVGGTDSSTYLSALAKGDVQGALRASEGLRTTPYWDVNHLRTGYGSDTVTLADGTIKSVDANTRITPDDANRDLARRTVEYATGARNAIGPTWDGMTKSAQSALTSMAYNYGHVPDDVVRAAKTGNPDAIAQAITAHANDNGGANYARRVAEADAVMGKTGGVSGPPSANGVPFSDADAAKNPWLRVEYLRSMAEAKPVRAQAFSEYETGSSATLKAGNPLSDDTVTGLIQTAQGDPTKEVKAAEIVGMNYALKAMQGGGAGGAPMTAAQITQATQEAFAAARAAPDHLHQVMATSMYNYMKEQGEWAEKHPLDDAARRYNKATPQPIDTNNPGTLPDNIAYRGALAQYYAAVNGSPTPSIFNSDEIPQVKSILANPDLAAKAQVYGAIANLPEAVRGATLKALGGNGPKAMAEAAAGSLMKEAPEVAQSIFKGQGVIETDKRFDPEGEGQQKVNYQAGLDDALPRSLFTKDDLRNPVGSYATTEQMIKYRYADLSSQASDKPPTAFSPDRLKQATDDVTGGVLSHNGGALIAPVRGMTQDAFDATVRGVSDSDLQGAMTLKGEKVTADYLHNTATLESAGDGKYFVKLDNNPSRPVYAYRQPQLPPDGDGKWGKFVLDLRNIKPSTQPYSPAPSVFAPPM